MAATQEQPVALNISVEGTCPDANTVAQELAPLVIRSGDDSGSLWTVRVTRAQRSTKLVLLAPGGTAVIERRIVSQDCAALARAFAAIIKTHLRALPQLPAPVSTAPLPSPQPASVVPPAAPAAQPDVSEQVVMPPAQPRSHLWVALSGGVRTSAEPRLLSAFGSADLLWPLSWPVAWRPGQWTLWMRGGVAAGTTTEQRYTGADVMVSVDSQQWAAYAHAGARFLDAGWYAQATAGPGLSVVQVRASGADDLTEQSAAIRLQPNLGVSLTGGRHLGARLWLRLDLMGTLFLRRDRYLIDPLGVVGSSPRAEITAALGIAVDIFGIASRPPRH